MRIALYVIWFLLPLFFFVVALWTKLENFSKKNYTQSAAEPFWQGILLLVCCFVALGIDQYLLESLWDTLSPDFIPLGFYQVMLLPVVILAAAKIVGPSKDIRIKSRTIKPRSRTGSGR